MLACARSTSCLVPNKTPCRRQWTCQSFLHGVRASHYTPPLVHFWIVNPTACLSPYPTASPPDLRVKSAAIWCNAFPIVPCAENGYKATILICGGNYNTATINNKGPDGSCRGCSVLATEICGTIQPEDIAPKWLYEAMPQGRCVEMSITRACMSAWV